MDVSELFPQSDDEGSGGILPENGLVGEVVEALVALGYSQSESVRAVKQVAVNDKTVEEILKAALKKLF